MDRHTLVLFIPVLSVFFGGLILLSRTAIGKAMARRIGGDRDAGGPAARLEAIEDELDRLRQELGEAHERIDFTERLLGNVGTPPAGANTPI